jgi:hypothetical protein
VPLDCPVHQRSNGSFAQRSTAKAEFQINNARTMRDRAGQLSEAHRTVNSACPVPLEDKGSNSRLRPNPNSWVTWLAHQTAATPNGCFGGWGYKYPPTTSTPTIQAFITLRSIQEQNTALQDTNQSPRSDKSSQFNSSL